LEPRGDVGAGEDLEKRVVDVVTGKQRREERREKATTREIDFLLIAMCSSHHDLGCIAMSTTAPSPTIPRPRRVHQLHRLFQDSKSINNPKGHLSRLKVSLRAFICIRGWLKE
jgi:hypothetical protein